MKQIRQGCFETNSSSVHAIVVYTAALMENDYSDIHFGFDEFGWCKHIYSMVSYKANYLWTAINNYYFGSDQLNQTKEKIVSWLNEDNINSTFSVKMGDSWSIGYIDHYEDLKDFLEWVLSDKRNLYQFLFSDKSFIETGNDNDEDALPYCGYEMRDNEDYKVFIK